MFKAIAGGHAQTLFYLVLFGVVFAGRDFVKIKFGPIHLLEWVAFALLLVLSYFQLRKSKETLPQQKVSAFWILAPFLIFFLIGMGRLGYDLVSGQIPNEDVSIGRSMQLALLFVYPAIWTFLGFFMARQFDSVFKGIAITLCLSQLSPNLSFENGASIGLGPLWVVGLFLLIFSSDRKHDLIPRWILLIVSVTGVLSFLSLFKGFVQRTTLVQAFTILMLLGLYTFAIQSKSLRNRLLQAVGVTAAILGITMTTGGFLRSTGVFEELERQSQNLQLSNLLSLRFSKWALLSSLMKGEDLEAGEFKGWSNVAKSRKYFWGQAIDEWRSAPIWGVGFSSEVPKMIWENDRNRYNFDFAGSAPVNGVHNSFLTILARMGLIGFLASISLAVLPFFSMWKLVKKSDQKVDVWSWLNISAYLCLMIYCLFNVGLESPHYASLIWLLAGVILGYESKNLPGVLRATDK